MSYRIVNCVNHIWFFLLMLTVASCSGNNFDHHDRTDPTVYKRCLLNADCANGEFCEKGFCQDIYFPRKDIKNY